MDNIAIVKYYHFQPEKTTNISISIYLIRLLLQTISLENIVRFDKIIYIIYIFITNNT